MAGRLLVGRGEVELGQMTCMNRRAGLMSKAGRLVLSQSCSGLVDVGGAGRVFAVAATVVIIAQCAVLGIEAVPAWVVHELVVAVAVASWIICAVVVVVVSGTGFAAIGGVGIIGLNGVSAGVVRGTKGTERWWLW